MALESLFSTPLDPVDEDACRETASDKAFPLRPLKKERKHWERDNLGNRGKANELEHADYPSGFNDRSTSDIDLNPHCDMKKAEAIAVKKEYVEDTHVDMSEPAFLDDVNSPSPCSDAGVHNSHGAYGAETGKPCPFPRMFMKRGSKRGKATHHVWAQEMGFSHRGQGRGWHNPGRGRSTMRRGRGRGPEGRGMWRGGRGRAAGREWETDYVFQLRRYKEEQEATVAAPFIQKEQNRRGGCGTFQNKTAEHLSVNNKKFKKRRNAMKMAEPKLKKQRVVCSFYMEGRCNKGDLCSFSHDAEPVKKREPCKFYAGGSCGKGEKCLYMHDDFPCKFFHTGTNCFQGDLCRFSHQPLTDETTLILHKVLNVSENAEDLNNPDTANGVMHSMDNEVSFGLDHFETLPQQMVFFQRSQSDESKDGVLSPQSNSASSPKSHASSTVEQCAARHKSITRLQPKTEAQTIKWPSTLKLSQERVKTEVNVSALSVSFSQLPPVTGLPAESTVRTVSILREEPVMIPLDSSAKYNFHDPRLERLSSCGVSTPPTFPKPEFAVGFVLDPEVSSSQVINGTGGAFLGSETWDRAPCRVMPMSTTQALDVVPLALNEGPLTSDKVFADTSQYWGAQNPHKDKTVSACDLLMAQTSQAGDSTSPEALSSPPADAQATDCVVAVHSLPVRPVPSSRNLRSLRRDAATPTLPSNQEGQPDSVSMKEVFKFSDPTASPFC